jgi:hypothetical protein
MRTLKKHGLATGLVLCCPLLLVASPGSAAPVLSPPVLTASFSPSTIVAGGSQTTTLTVTATNPNPTPGVDLIANVHFSNTYPAGLVFDGVGPSTCGTTAGSSGGSATYTATGFDVTAGLIAAGFSCNVVVFLHASTAGTFVDTTSAPTSSQTGPGNPATATLTATPEPVPSLGDWSLIGFALLLGGFAYRRARRRIA